MYESDSKLEFLADELSVYLNKLNKSKFCYKLAMEKTKL